jgi:hypothetical protein
MTDAELAALLRATLPLADHAPTGDLWPRLLARASAPPIAWSRLDLGLAAAILAGTLAILALRPGWLLLLAYHL